jgi:hypothetical protein
MGIFGNLRIHWKEYVRSREERTNMLKFYRQSFASLVLTAIATFLPLSGTTLAQNGGPGPLNYAGYLDHAGCDTISGWAADRNRLNSSITVAIYSDGVLIASAGANLSRRDVGNLLGDNGLHGFTVATPPNLKDGQAHQITVLFESSAVAVNNNPASVTCVPTQPPPLCADQVITVTPSQGLSRTWVNHFCRDKFLRTRYENDRFVTINSPDARETSVFDKVTQTYGVFPWPDAASVTDFTAAVSAPLTAQGPKPPVHPPAGCPTGNDGWSATTPVPPQNIVAPPIAQTLNVWTCPSLVLLMYLEIIGPDGTTDLELQKIDVRDPDPQWFTVPAGYTQDNSLSSSASSISGCTVRQTLDPIILVTSGSHLGQTVVTAIADGYGCYFTDATIYVGQSLSAMPLTLKGSPVFQLSLFDNGNSQYKNAVDTAQIFLTTSGGTIDKRSMILVKIN